MYVYIHASACEYIKRVIIKEEEDNSTVSKPQGMDTSRLNTCMRHFTFPSWPTVEWAHNSFKGWGKSGSETARSLHIKLWVVRSLKAHFPNDWKVTPLCLLLKDKWRVEEYAATWMSHTNSPIENHIFPTNSLQITELCLWSWQVCWKVNGLWKLCPKHLTCCP